MDTEPTPRTARLRRALGLSQPDFAWRLGVSQSTVSRLELGQPETGPVSRLLDFLEAGIDPAPPDAGAPVQPASFP